MCGEPDTQRGRTIRAADWSAESGRTTCSTMRVEVANDPDRELRGDTPTPAAATTPEDRRTRADVPAGSVPQERSPRGLVRADPVVRGAVWNETRVVWVSTGVVPAGETWQRAATSGGGETETTGDRGDWPAPRPDLRPAGFGERTGRRGPRREGAACGLIDGERSRNSARRWWKQKRVGPRRPGLIVNEGRLCL